MPLINRFGPVRTEKDNSMRIKEGGLEGPANSALRFFAVIPDRNTSKGIRRIPLSDSKVAERQRDKTNSERARNGI